MTEIEKLRAEVKVLKMAIQDQETINKAIIETLEELTKQLQNLKKQQHE